jgi:hypothetical protein
MARGGAKRLVSIEYRAETGEAIAAIGTLIDQQQSAQQEATRAAAAIGQSQQALAQQWTNASQLSRSQQARIAAQGARAEVRAHEAAARERARLIQQTLAQQQAAAQQAAAAHEGSWRRIAMAANKASTVVGGRISQIGTNMFTLGGAMGVAAVAAGVLVGKLSGLVSGMLETLRRSRELDAVYRDLVASGRSLSDVTGEQVRNLQQKVEVTKEEITLLRRRADAEKDNREATNLLAQAIRQNAEFVNQQYTEALSRQVRGYEAVKLQLTGYVTETHLASAALDRFAGFSDQARRAAQALTDELKRSNWTEIGTALGRLGGGWLDDMISGSGGAPERTPAQLVIRPIEALGLIEQGLYRLRDAAREAIVEIGAVFEAAPGLGGGTAGALGRRGGLPGVVGPQGALAGLGQGIGSVEDLQAGMVDPMDRATEAMVGVFLGGLGDMSRGFGALVDDVGEGARQIAQSLLSSIGGAMQSLAIAMIAGGAAAGPFGVPLLLLGAGASVAASLLGRGGGGRGARAASATAGVRAPLNQRPVERHVTYVVQAGIAVASEDALRRTVAGLVRTSQELGE